MPNEGPVDERIEKLFEDNGIPIALSPFCKGYSKGTKKNPKTNVMILNWGKEVKERSYTNAKTFFKSRTIREEDLIDNGHDNNILKDLKKAGDIVPIKNLFEYDFFLRPMQNGFFKGIKKIWPSENEIDAIKCEWNNEPDKAEKKNMQDDFELDLKKSVKLFKSVMEIAKPNLVIILGNTLKSVVEYGLKTNLEQLYNDAIFVAVPYSYYEIGVVNADWLIFFSQFAEKKSIKNINLYLEKKYSDYWFPLTSILKDEFSKKASFSYNLNRDVLKKLLEWLPNVLPHFFAQNLNFVFLQFLKSVDTMLEKNLPKPADIKDIKRTEKARSVKAEKRRKTIYGVRG